MREEMRAGHNELMAIMETNQEKIMAKFDVHHERMMARMDSQLDKMEASVETNQKAVNAMDLEAKPEEIRVRGGALGGP
jgi:hypothetical protein